MQIRRNEVLTGLLVIATLAVLTGILVLLGAPGLFRPLTTYKIYFDNAAGIKLGAPVLLAGRKIGQVAALYSPVSKEESQRAVDVAKSLQAAEANATPAPEKTARYEVRIDVQVDRSAQLYRDSKARMCSRMWERPAPRCLSSVVLPAAHHACTLATGALRSS